MEKEIIKTITLRPVRVIRQSKQNPYMRGLVLNGSYYVSLYRVGDKYTYTVGDSITRVCGIKYIHQLQHVLRLCGIEHEITR